MDDNSKLAVIETLLTVQGKATDRIEANLKEWRAETVEAIRAHERQTQEKLDHARKNNDQKFEAVARQLAEKVSMKDLEANQRDSDERYAIVKATLAAKASSESVHALTERVEVIAASGDSLKDHVIKWVLTSVLAATIGAGGFFAVKAATERHTPVAQAAPVISNHQTVETPAPKG